MDQWRRMRWRRRWRRLSTYIPLMLAVIVVIASCLHSGSTCVPHVGRGDRFTTNSR